MSSVIKLDDLIQDKEKYLHVTGSVFMKGACLCFQCSCGRHKCKFSHVKTLSNLLTVPAKSQY